MVNEIGTWKIGRIEDEPHGYVPKFWGFNEKGGDVFLKDVRVVVEDIGNWHENIKFGFRIKEELAADEKEMLKNMSEIR